MQTTLREICCLPRIVAKSVCTYVSLSLSLSVSLFLPSCFVPLLLFIPPPPPLCLSLPNLFHCCKLMGDSAVPVKTSLLEAPSCFIPSLIIYSPVFHSICCPSHYFISSGSEGARLRTAVTSPHSFKSLPSLPVLQA